MTTEEIAAHLRKPVTWIYNNADRMGLPRHRLGRQYRYRLSEVDAWVHEQTDGKRA
jgi:excisionase family DNA binding protein